MLRIAIVDGSYQISSSRPFGRSRWCTCLYCLQLQTPRKTARNGREEKDLPRARIQQREWICLFSKPIGGRMVWVRVTPVLKLEANVKGRKVACLMTISHLRRVPGSLKRLLGRSNLDLKPVQLYAGQPWFPYDVLDKIRPLVNFITRSQPFSRLVARVPQIQRDLVNLLGVCLSPASKKPWCSYSSRAFFVTNTVNTSKCMIK